MSLDIYNTEVTDITPLASLMYLEFLNLANNQISDITPLLVMNLTIVILINNPIEVMVGSPNAFVVQYFIENNIICDLNGLFIPDDHSDSPVNATPILINSDITALFEYTLDSDYFVFTLDEVTVMNISSTNENGLMLLYNELLEPITEFNSYPQSYLGELQPGTYYIRLLANIIEMSEPYVLYMEQFIDAEIIFDDVNLENIMREITGIYDRPLFKSDGWDIAELDLQYRNINDLTGIEGFVNLSHINLTNNDITDITPLLELSKLDYVLLRDNPIDLTEGTVNYDVITYFITNGITSDLNGLLIDDDHSDIASNATELVLNSVVTGGINYDLDKDFFVFTLTENTIIDLAILGEWGGAIAILYDENFNVIAQIDSYVTMKRSINSGTYYIGVFSNYALDNYQLSYFEYIPAINEIIFNDSNLERAVRNFLNIYDRPIYIEDVNYLKEFYAGGYEITDLTGLEHFVNLQNLDLGYNQITDLTPIMNLTFLDGLLLDDNLISDFTPLMSLSNLGYLSLRNNAITDLAWMSSLSNLFDVNLDDNQITDISPLANSGIIYLMLRNNLITDITPVGSMDNLNFIYLRNNPIDLLVDSANYNVILDLYQRNIDCDITGIFILDDHSDSFEAATIISINTLKDGFIDYHFDQDFFTFTLSETTPVKFYSNGHFSLEGELYDESMNVLSYFIDYNTFTLTAGTYYLRITSQEQYQTGPYQFICEQYTPGIEVHFTDINLEAAIRYQIQKYNTPLYVEDVERIEYLEASGYSISDLSGIENLISLRYLNLSYNQLDNILLLQTLVKLEKLILLNNVITDISILMELPRLREVQLSENPIMIEDTNVNYQTLLYLMNNHVYCDIYNQLPDDHADDYSHSTTIVLNSDIVGNMDYFMDQDWFTFTLTETTNILIYASSQNYIWKFIFDENLNQVVYGDPYLPITCELLAGTYYIKLEGDLGNYRLYLKEFNLNQVINFNDSQLELAIREQLGIYDRPILAMDVLFIHSLTLINYHISDLSGLEYFISLHHLDLNENQISDLSVLTSLTSLEVLLLLNNQITDITPLLSIPSLQIAMLNRNPINLTVGNDNYNVITYFYEHKIECDLILYLDPNIILFNDYYLEEAIRNNLGIYDRPIYISDVEMITDLDLGHQNITDLTGLEHFISLQMLLIHYNYISDLTPIANLSHLTILSATKNQISDITPLQNLTQLNYLVLEGNAITNINLLVNFSNLYELYISYNPISDITPLSSLTNLNTLILSGMGITDITPLANLINLNKLHLINNEITDITPLVNMTNLVEIFLRDNPLDLTVNSDTYNTLYNYYISGMNCDLFGIFINDDHSDEPLNATPITIDSLTTGSIDYQFDQDYFVFTLTEETHIRFYSQLINGFRAQLFDSSMNKLETNYNSRFDIILTAGTYYIKITAINMYAYEFNLIQYNPDDEIIFNDFNLDLAIRDMIGLYDCPLYLEDIQDISYLYASDRGISDLTGIELLTSLYDINLMNNLITDITPLMMLPQLKYVWLSGNPIDLSVGSSNLAVLQYFNDNWIEHDLILDDHGNSSLDATQIALNTNISGFIAMGDEDFFVFTLNEETSLMIYTTGWTDTYGVLYGEGMNYLIEDDDTGEDANFKIMITLLPGTYYLNVYGYDHTQVGSYDLYLTSGTETLTVAEAILLPDGSAVRVEAIVVANSYYGYVIYSGGDYGFVNTGSVGDASMGDLIVIDASVTTKYGLREFINPILYQIKSQDNPIPEMPPGTLFELINRTKTAATITGTVSIEGINNSVYLTDIEGFKLEVYFKSTPDYFDTDGAVLKAYNGQIITLPIIWYGEGSVLFVGNDSDIILNSSEPIVFNDVNLENAIRNQLGIYDRPINLVDAQNVTDLFLPSQNISDLTGLEKFINLHGLILVNNEITDITPVQNLTQLIILDLTNNQVSDLTSLMNLYSLNTLFLVDNVITDISSLANLSLLNTVLLLGNPIDLTEGNASYNLIIDYYNRGVNCDLYNLVIQDDYSDVVENATAITVNSIVTGNIDYQYDQDYFVFTLIEETHIKIYNDIMSCIQIQLFDVNMNQLAINDQFYRIDMHLMAGTYYLKITNYQITNYEFELLTPSLDDIVGFNDTTIEQFVRGTIGIFDAPIYIQDLRIITHLEIVGYFISDLTGIENLTNLIYLNLQYNNIMNITPLLSLPNLEYVYIMGNPIDLTIGSDNYNIVKYFIDHGIYCDLQLPDDHGNYQDSATVIQLDESKLGLIDTSEDVDYFVFTLTETTDMNITVRTFNDSNMWFTLYNEYEIDLGYGDDIYPIILSSLQPGIYYLYLYGEIGEYQLNVNSFDANQVITFNDSNFELVIRNYVSIYDRAIVTSDVIYIDEIYLDNYNILDITGLEYFINLRFLELNNNQITDLSSLSNLYNLQQVFLQNNLIADISPLTTLPSLQFVHLLGNPIDLTVGNNVLDYFTANGINCDLFVDDHGNSYLDATSIQLNTNTYGNIHMMGDEDWFVFTVEVDSIIQIYTASGMDSFGVLYGEGMEILAINDDYDDEGNFYLNVTLLPGTYYLNVYGYSHVMMGSYYLYLMSENVPIVL